LAADEAAALPWICYDEQMGDLPHARWLSARAHSASTASAAFNDAEAILQAVVAGIGVSLLPRAIADRHPALRHCPRPDLPDPPAREVWLLSHPDQRGLPRVAAVVEWLERTLRAAGIRS
jgi:DNA-binding transcriptional LysR family regulator